MPSFRPEIPIILKTTMKNGGKNTLIKFFSTQEIIEGDILRREVKNENVTEKIILKKILLRNIIDTYINLTIVKFVVPLKTYNLTMIIIQSLMKYEPYAENIINRKQIKIG